MAVRWLDVLTWFEATCSEGPVEAGPEQGDADAAEAASEDSLELA